MAYTNVAKPTGTPYTDVRNGSPLYDDLTILYDDPNTFYDGDSPLVYTNISKPTSTTYTKVTKPT